MCYLFGPVRSDFDAGKSIGRALNIKTFLGLKWHRADYGAVKITRPLIVISAQVELTVELI